MDYKNIIFLTKDSIKAVDVDLDGNCDVISLNGHETVVCKTEQEFSAFCDCLKEAYNIDEFSDLDIETLVIYCKVKNEMLFVVHELLKDCKQLNMIDMEKLLPVIAEKKGLLPTEGKVLIEFAGMYYQVSCGADHVVQVRFAKASEENCIHLQDADFNILYCYKNQMAASQEATNKIKEECQLQMEALKEQFAATEEKLKREKENLLDKIRQYEAQEAAKKEAEKRNNFKRIIYKLDYNASIPIWIEEDDFKNRYYKSMFFYPPTEKDVPLMLDKYQKKSLNTREAINAVKVRVEGDVSDDVKTSIFTGLTIKKLYKDNSYVNKGTVIGLIKYCEELTKKGGIFSCLANNNTDDYYYNLFFEIKAEMDGKIYWIDNHGEYLQDQDDYLILIEKDDTKADAIEWYKETKAKEAEDNVGTF